ncbi:MAG: hypothetical protein AB7G93_23530 [Bdellovibrionales bacterium]
MSKEIGIVTPLEIDTAVVQFLAESQWQPGLERVLLQDLHKEFLCWLGVNRMGFSIPQRQFCRHLIKHGYRAAYANIKGAKGWNFRKIIFASNTAATGSSQAPKK